MAEKGVEQPKNSLGKKALMTGLGLATAVAVGVGAREVSQRPELMNRLLGNEKVDKDASLKTLESTSHNVESGASIEGIWRDSFKPEGFSYSAYLAELVSRNPGRFKLDEAGSIQGGLEAGESLQLPDIGSKNESDRELLEQLDQQNEKMGADANKAWFKETMTEKYTKEGLTEKQVAEKVKFAQNEPELQKALVSSDTTRFDLLDIMRKLGYVNGKE